jgi:hypothetical protein
MAVNSFDIVSKIDLQEVNNAIHQAEKDLGTRYDLKNSKSSIELDQQNQKITLRSQDDFTLRAVSEILDQKLVKRGVPLKGLNRGNIQEAAGSTVTQEITLQQGIPMEHARQIVKLIKDKKLKVQSSIQGDQVRVSGKNRDDLQAVIAFLKQQTFDIDMQFTNYRTS